MQFGCIKLSRERCYSVFPEILVLVPYQILLHSNVQNFACSILSLKDEIDIVFTNMEGEVLNTIFLEFLVKFTSCVLMNEITQKFTRKIQINRNNNEIF